ncbi:MAG: translocation/assembly module TamB domain-containing protein, partial [Nitrospirota bacterium]
RFRNIAGLDRFQVDPYVTGSSSAGGPRLTVGKSLIDGRLYMTYSATIGTSEEQVIRLEYILGRNVFLVGVRDEQGQVGGDLKFRFEFR